MVTIWLGFVAAWLGGVAVAGPVGREASEHPFFRSAPMPEWSRMSAEQVLVDARAAMEQVKENMRKIAEVKPETANFENTFLAYVERDAELQQVQCYLYHLVHTLGSPALHRADEQLIREYAVYAADTPHHEAVWAVLEAAARAPWVSQLSPAKQHFIRRTMQRFRASGAHLNLEQRARKAALDAELQQLSIQFNKNLSVRSRWELLITDEAALDGLSEQWKQRARQAAQAKGHAAGWLVTSPRAPEVLAHCTVEETRKACWPGTNTVGTAQAGDNEPVVARIMELRQELAELLGFRHFADMKAATLMMGSGEKALAFVDEMLRLSKPAWDAHVAEQMKRFSEVRGAELRAIEPWNEAYYARLHPSPTQKTQFDRGVITPYLQADQVLRGMFRIWENHYGITISELPTACLSPGETCPTDKVEVWHPAVRAFRVLEAATGELHGYFYLDLYPRARKRGMAWCMPLRFGAPRTAESPQEPHFACMVTNVTPPPAQGEPHLLNHGDLYVLFHEFGHLMHMMLARGELRAQAAMEVENDFVETPSQMQENWIWVPEALMSFARHHETGEPLPLGLAQKLAASRAESPIAMHMRMLCSAKLDLELNMHYAEKFRGRPLDEAADALLAPWQFPYTAPQPCEMRTLFYCISEGYSASFYTYKWSEALAADIFLRFCERGVLNPEVGRAYRKAIA
ncbi:MAG: hypothetical protein II349_07235 [Akkermansia sp.]|nr:hypothetical protein [Akkermansia sp.]